MKKAFAVLTAGAAMSLACSGGGESQDSFNSSAEKLKEERAPFVVKAWSDGLKDFLAKLQAGNVTVQYFQDNCDYFEDEAGSVIRKNPASFHSKKPDSDIDIEIFGSISVANGINLLKGPYVYSDPFLKDKNVRIVSPEEPRRMKPSSGSIDVQVTSANSDGTTVWLNGPNGLQISKTVIVEHLPTGETDKLAVDGASQMLCGQALGLARSDYPLPSATPPSN